MSINCRISDAASTGVVAVDPSLDKLLTGLVQAASAHEADVESVLARLASALGVERIVVLGYSEETRRFITLHHAALSGIGAPPEVIEAELLPHAVASLQHAGFRYEQSAAVPQADRAGVALLGARSLLGLPLALGHGARGYVVFESFGAERRFEPEWFSAGAHVVQRALERQRAQAEAQSALARAQYELSELLTAFLGHDLRNPLSAISGLTQLVLRREGLPEEVVRRVSAIEHAVRRTNRWLETLLGFLESRSPAGLQLATTNVDLHELVGRVVREQLSMRGDRRIVLEPASALFGSWDPARVAQLIGHVLANAQSSSDGSEPVHVALSATPDRAVLTVASSGPTLTAAVAARLFDPMGPREPPELARPRSLRLGLYMARRFAEAHGGSLDVELLEHSTVFTVRLPTNAG
jgi:signal transduction histidine kinase